LDLVEVNNRQEIAAFKCNWEASKVYTPKAFEKAYPNATFNVIVKDNYVDFIS